MSIGSKLGMAFSTNDLTATAAASSIRTGTITSEVITGESSFQKMINQMLENNKNLSTGDANLSGTDLDIGNRQEINGIGDLIPSLLFNSSNHTKLKIQSIEYNPASYQEIGAQQDSGSESKDYIPEEALASILARFDGAFNAYYAENNGNAGFEATGEKLGADALSALIGPVQETGYGLKLLKDNKTLNNLNAALGSIKAIIQEDGNSGRMTVLAELNGKKVAFTGSVKTEIAGSAEFNESKSPAAVRNGLYETLRGINETELSELLNADSVKKSGTGSMDMINEQLSFKSSVQASAEQQEMGISEEAGRNENLPSEVTASKEIAETEGIGNSIKADVYQSQLQATGNAELSAATQTVESPEPYSQIRDEILSRMEQDGPSEFRMKLDPEDLGQIDIKLKLSEGKLVIDILAANSKTHALLASQVDRLISSMGLQNVQVESVQVSQQMNSQTQDNSQSQGYSMNDAMDFSQRRQQEQYQRELSGNRRQNASYGIQPDETLNINAPNRIEAARFDSYRMNYTI